MKLKQIIGVVLMCFMSYSLWNKLQESVSDVDQPIATGLIIILLILIIVVLVVRVLRYE